MAIWLGRDDMKCRGFLLGGTAGLSATLAGEGLHQDDHSHLLAATIPNRVAYDPRTRMSWRSCSRQPQARAMCGDRVYCITMEQNYEHPPMPAGVAERVIRGMSAPWGRHR
ncbi:MAG: hypothetical protein U1F34_08290 [Gammaproteobacteria bacterium]